MSVSRRAALAGAGAAAAGAAVAVAGPAAASASEAAAGETTHESFRVVDKRGRQALLVSTRKPPVIIGGVTYPASQRSGPDPATYLLFNAENGDERGGIIASADAAQLSLDYPNLQGITLGCTAFPGGGAAGLSITQPVDPALPADQVKPRTGIELGSVTGQGTTLALHDSAGNPRIVLEVGPDDVPSIRVLDASGKVVRTLF